MKKLLLSLLFTLPVMAQDGFRNENGNLVWQHTYPATTNVLTVIGNQPDLKVEVGTNDAQTGYAEKIKNTCSEGSPVMRNDYKFNFNVKNENGNYVVTVTDIKIIEVMGPMQARTIVNRCEKYLVDASLKVKKDARSQKDVGCIDNFLTGIFSGTMANVAMTEN
ncbi:MAG: hypothetical protein DI539_13945 [Flavobacterium psychrophilum]|nr:MAG: hypothetical protein DI539_13945 [Flavobacterium psychrophilum]